MTFLFAYSASVQLDDPDWYLWFPLYASACIVNLVNGYFFSKTMGIFAKLTLSLGNFLFIKVVLEDHLKGVAGFWSGDMRKKLVREKIGSGLVVTSMFLQLEASSLLSKDPLERKEMEIPRFAVWGMAMLVVVTYGISAAFFLLPRGEVKFQ